MDSTRYIDTSEVPICAESPIQVHKLDRLFVHLADCRKGERHVTPPLVRWHMISVLASYTFISNAAHAVTITVIISANPSSDRDTMPASSAYSISDDVWADISFLCPSTLPARVRGIWCTYVCSGCCGDSNIDPSLQCSPWSQHRLGCHSPAQPGKLI